MLLLLIKHVVGSLARDSGRTITVVLLLGAGIGINASVFSVVSAVLVRPLPYPHADRVVTFRQFLPPLNRSVGGLSADLFAAWRAQSTALDVLASYRETAMTLTGEGEPKLLDGMAVTEGLLQLLGVGPALGRSFNRDDFSQSGTNFGGGHPSGSVVLLSHGAWLRYWGGKEDVIGDAIVLDGAPHTVIGVMPRDFFFMTTRANYWVPLSLPPPPPDSRALVIVRAVGRLAEDASIEVARSEGLTVLRRAVGNDGVPNVDVVPLRSVLTEHLSEKLMLLQLSVSFVFLLACTNVGSIVLIRVSSRVQEVVTRLSLGATTRHLLLQYFLESIFLAALGGFLGLSLAMWSGNALASVLPFDDGRIPPISVDIYVVVFAVGLCFLLILTFTLLPVLVLVRRNRLCVMPGHSMFAERQRSLYQNAILAAQFALAFALLTAASAMVNSLLALARVELGFRPQGVLTLRVTLPSYRYPDTSAVLTFYSTAESELIRYTRTGFASQIPMADASTYKLPVVSLSAPEVEQQGEQVNVTIVTASYFQVMGIPLLRGSVFDALVSNPVPVLVNSSFAAAHLGDLAAEEVLGKRVVVGGVESTITGIVGDVRQRRTQIEPVPTVFIALKDASRWNSLGFALRSMYVVVSSPYDLPIQNLRGVFSNLDPDLPLEDIAAMEHRVQEDLAEQRFYVGMMGACASFGLLIAAVGVYAAVSRAAQQRFREIGIRMAIGATSANIARDLVLRVLLSSSIGLLLGVFVSWVLVSVLAVQIDVLDKGPVGVSWFSALGTLLFATLIAGIGPVYRATTRSPLSVLKYE